MNKAACTRRLGPCDAGQRFLSLYRHSRPQGRAFVITALGGGGKTTLLKYLFNLYRKSGLRVALTTSCKLGWQEGFISDPDAIKARADQGVYIGIQADEHHVQGIGEEALASLLSHFDVVLIEGDGAKRLPVKVPLAHEPVIYPFSDHSLMVAGLSALWHPLQEKCFRLTEAQRLLQTGEETVITPAVLADLIRLGYLDNPALSPHMGEKAWVVLNQCDRPARLNAFLKIKNTLPVPVLATNARHHDGEEEHKRYKRWWLG